MDAKLQQLPKVMVNGLETFLWFNDPNGGEISISLICDEGDGLEPYTDATKRDYGLNLDANEVAIKDYSDNVGVLQGLIDAGIVAKPHRAHQLPFAQLHVCRLLIEAKNPFGEDEWE